MHADFIPMSVIHWIYKTRVYNTVDKIPIGDLIHNQLFVALYRHICQCPFSLHFAKHLFIIQPQTPENSAIYRCYIFGIAVAVSMSHNSASGNGANRKESNMEAEYQAEVTCSEEPRILEEIQVEELAIDGICGVY